MVGRRGPSRDSSQVDHEEVEAKWIAHEEVEGLDEPEVEHRPFAKWVRARF